MDKIKQAYLGRYGVIKLFLYLCLTMGANIVHASNSIAYISGVSEPWGKTSYKSAMDTVFGVDQWTDYRMADGTMPFEGGYTFIYLEGSDSTGIELQDYLDANRTLIENYVSDGGVLFINAAENDVGTDDIYIGFGDIHILTNFSANVVAVDPEHPIWQGPYTPVSLTNSGNSFGHADVDSTENTITNIITGDVGDSTEGKIVFGTFTYGSGFVLIGGMTAVEWHSPTENDENVNLLLNMLSYVGTTVVNELKNNAPVMTGTPATTAAEGVNYSFIPTVMDEDDDDTQTFSISGKPSWANFDPATGQLSGTPTNDDIGSSTDIIISVSDGVASASLLAFDIEVTTTDSEVTTTKFEGFSGGSMGGIAILLLTGLALLRRYKCIAMS